ncbi:DUF948 domain-containing protein [Fundicoccus culcitae]|uniref:DUF948 domain-containing protein n=1 Tax=Fundicoccus culcitae TaxID=2969821 RepID=A0ABY5P6Z9_9LACT|nr:DUF948 domain-containing protein [Fundicoccus culcitae]UUX34375.1 DUF948 domain-containing protein [Fundicoccus culcitae]
MTLGGIAGLIAALAFAVLVVFICLNLSKLSKIMEEIQKTVQHLNSTIDVVTKDVDNLSIEVEGLLNKANTLVDDVNGKLGKTDPLFTAIGDLGVTVSDLNESTKGMANNLVNGISKKKKSPIDRFVKSTKGFTKTKENSQLSDPVEKAYEESAALTQLQKELEALAKTTPSTTAGEISIK